MVVQGYTCLYKVVHGCPRLYMVAKGLTMLYMVVQDCIWLHKVVQGCTEVYMAVHGCKRLPRVLIMLVVPNRSELPLVHKTVFQSNQRMHSVHAQPCTTMYNFVKTMYNLLLPWTVFDNHVQTWTSI